MLQHGLHHLQKARPQHRVGHVSLGFGHARDAELVRHLAEAQPPELRQDEPNPMGLLAAVAHFGQRDRIRVLLRLDETLQVKGIGTHCHAPKPERVCTSEAIWDCASAPSDNKP